MRQYPKYKVTNIPWVPLIPEEWNETKLGHILTKECRERPADAELLVCSNSGEVTKRGDSKLGLVAESNEIYQGVKAGDLLIHGMDTWHGAIAVSDYDGMCTPVVHVCSSTQSKRFVAYFMRMLAFNKVFKLISNGVRQNTSDFRSWDKVKQLVVALPPLPEQEAIVAFLDDKCTKIDAYVETKTKEIALLKEQKQAVINQAVTRGLNPNAPLKDSGIPWLGRVPKHWKVERVREHFSQRVEKVSDKDYAPLSVCKFGIVPQLDDVAVSNAEGNSRKKVCVGDYVVNSRSDRKSSCGISKNEGSVSLINIVLEPRNILGDFVHYLFRCNDWVEDFYRNGRGIVADLWTTRYSEMRNMFLPVPPLPEQEAIVAFLDDKCAKIDAAIANIEKQINNVKEYKQSLINDAVTGQIDVRA